MKTDFDLERVGKRLPYTVPDDFFAALEENIRQEAMEGKAVACRRHLPVRVVMRTVTAIAAAAALFFAVDFAFFSGQGDALGSVEQAFGRLSAEDQDYIMEIYQEDIFINE